MNKYIIYKGTGGLFHNLSGLTFPNTKSNSMILN